MTREKEKAKSFFDGAFMAWEDCAAFAQNLADNAHAIPAAPEFSESEMLAVRAQAKMFYSIFAEAIRTRAQNARNLLEAAEKGLQ